jgi:hypothetical protein
LKYTWINGYFSNKAYQIAEETLGLLREIKKIRRSTLYGRVQYYEFFHAYLQVLSACISPFKGLKVVDHIALILEHSLLSGLNDFQQKEKVNILYLNEKEICMQNELSWTNDLCLHIMSHCALDVLENPETLDYPTQYI